MMPRMLGRGLFVLCASLAVWGQGGPTISSGNNFHEAGPAVSVSSSYTLKQAYALLESQNFKEAANDFAVLAEANPKSIEAQLGLVRALFQAGKFKAASHAGESAMQQNPESSPIHAILADVYFREGLFDFAEREYKAALGMEPGSGRAWIGLGRIYSIRSMPEQAKRAFQKAGEGNPRVLSNWLAALPSPEQVATYREYAVKDERPAASDCELSSASLDHPSENQEVPLTPIVDENGYLHGAGIKARIDGRQHALLLLDTGASGITLGSDLAARTGIVALSDRELHGIGGNGNTQGHVARIARMRIGNLEFRNCVVQISKEKKILAQDGIIGADVFRKYLITIDFAGRKMSLSEHEKPKTNLEFKGDADTLIHAYEFAHFLLVQAKAGQGASGLFVLDSGANANTISNELSSKVGGMVSSPRFIQGSTGIVNSALATDSATLEIGNTNVDQQTVAAIDLSSLSKHLGTEIAGQIGFSALKKLCLKIDYQTGTVYLMR